MSIEKLGRDVFLLLAEVAVADGTTHAAEVDALLRAARAEGLQGADLEVIEAAANHHPGAQHASVEGLAHDERLFVYAIAYWVARIDDAMSEEEDAVLGKLGQRLDLTDAARMAAEGLVDEVCAASKTHERFDLALLRSTIGDRLRALEESAEST